MQVEVDGSRRFPYSVLVVGVEEGKLEREEVEGFASQKMTYMRCVRQRVILYLDNIRSVPSTPCWQHVAGLLAT